MADQAKSLSNKVLDPVKKDTETIRSTVLTNLVKMLGNRKWITEENIATQIKSIIDANNDDHYYKIKLDVYLAGVETYEPADEGKEKKKDPGFLDNVIAVKLLQQKVSSVGKSPIIQEFLSGNKNMHKIIVVEEISDKARQNLKNFPHTEVFEEYQLMVNLLDISCSPKYEVLTPTESIVMLDAYELTKSKMKVMFDSDPASLYFYLKMKQIVRIIRDSELTGKSTDYRIVVHKTA